MKHPISLLAFLIVFVGPSSSAALTLTLTSGYVRYEVRIKTLGIGGDDVSGVNRSVAGKIHIAEGIRVEGGLIVPVVEFDSNNSRRDKDVAKILKYREYPAITFEVVDMERADIERVLSSDSGQVKLRAKLAAAGGSKVYDVVLAYRALGSNVIRFTTSIDARFTDFGIDPPRLGLILKTAPDKISLSGDLVFEVEKEKEGQP